MPKVGIVILNWNGWRDTIECLESLQSIDYVDFKIIVVDNASTNDSVDQIKLHFPYIKVIESVENGGFSKGNNIGIRAALEDGADYIWMLNNDTTVSVTALKALVDEAERKPCLGIVGSVLYEYDQPGAVQAWGGGKINRLLPITSNCIAEGLDIDYITGASMLIRRKVIDEIGMLDERFFFFMEDVEYSIRVQRAGWGIGVSSKSRVYHKGGSSLNDSTQIGKSFHSDVLYSQAVGTFMRVSNRGLIIFILRAGLALFTRARKKQWSRILPVANAYWSGYKIENGR